jgi:hypothetical protein
MDVTDDNGRSRLLLASAAVLALAFVYVGTSRYGINIQSDAVAFVSAAQGLLEGRGFTLYNGESLAGWPPLYPLLLALLGSTGLEMAETARLVIALSFAGTVVLAGVLLRRARVGKLELGFGLLSILLAPVMIQRWQWALSELPFFVFELLCLFSTQRFLVLHEKRWLLAASVAGGLSCLTRYAGVGVVLAAGLVLLLDQGRSFRRRIVDAWLLGVGAVVINIPWVLRNYRLHGTWSGLASLPATTSLGENISRLLEVAGGWFLPPRAPVSARQLVGVALFALCMWAVVTGSRGLRSAEATPRDRPALLLAAGSFALGYAAFLVASLTGVFIDSDPDRLLSPSFVPLITVIATAAHEVRSRAQRKRASAIVVPAILAGMLVWPARFTLGAMRYSIQHGAGGYATTRWRSSPLIRALRTVAPTGTVLSNEPHALFVIAGMRSVRGLPDHGRPGAPPTADSALRVVRGQLRGRPTYVALFGDPPLARYRYSEEDLRRVFRTTLVAQHPDGSIYLIR